MSISFINGLASCTVRRKMEHFCIPHRGNPKESGTRIHFQGTELWAALGCPFHMQGEKA
jgi:hypothetical protein